MKGVGARLPYSTNIVLLANWPLASHVSRLSFDNSWEAWTNQAIIIVWYECTLTPRRGDRLGYELESVLLHTTVPLLDRPRASRGQRMSLPEQAGADNTCTYHTFFRMLFKIRHVFSLADTRVGSTFALLAA